MGSWREVGLVGGWQVTASVCFYAVFAATAFVREAFSVSRTLAGVVVTVVILGYTAALFPMGALVDGAGERPVMVWSLLGLAVATLGVAAAPSYGLLLVALLVLGVAYASAMPATNRAVLVVAPRGRRNLALNVKQVGVTAGSGIAALLVTGAATTRFGWRVGFVGAAVAALVATLAFAAWYRDHPGSGTVSLPDVRALFADPNLRTLVAAGFFFGTGVYTTTGYVVLHMTEAAGATAGLAGVALAAAQVTGSLGRLGGGALADRLPWGDARANAAVLLGQGVVAVVLLVGVTATGTPPTAALTFAALGTFILGFTGIYHSCLTALVPDGDLGAATAGGQLSLNVGGLLAPPAFGYLADTVSYDAGWLALAATTALGSLLTARLLARTS